MTRSASEPSSPGFDRAISCHPAGEAAGHHADAAIMRLSGAAAAAKAPEIAYILSQAFDAPAQHWPAESVAATLTAPGSLALLADDGCALVRVAADEAETLTLAVAPAARRRGLGAALVRACIAAAAEAGATRLHLEVGAGNAAALALYAGAGFTVTGRRPGYYRGPDGREDAVLMARDLPTRA